MGKLEPLPIPPVNVSPLIKLSRWIALIAGIITGFKNQRKYSIREQDIRIQEKLKKDLKDRELAREKSIFDAAELVELEKIFLGTPDVPEPSVRATEDEGKTSPRSFAGDSSEFDGRSKDFGDSPRPFDERPTVGVPSITEKTPQSDDSNDTTKNPCSRDKKTIMDQSSQTTEESTTIRDTANSLEESPRKFIKSPTISKSVSKHFKGFRRAEKRSSGVEGMLSTIDETPEVVGDPSSTILKSGTFEKQSSNAEDTQEAPGPSSSAREVEGKIATFDKKTLSRSIFEKFVPFLPREFPPKSTVDKPSKDTCESTPSNEVFDQTPETSDASGSSDDRAK